MLRKIVLQIHTWLGLVTGIVVLVVSLTGCLYVFADELKTFFYHGRNYVEEVKPQVLPLSVLTQTARKALGDSLPVSRCEIYADPRRSYVFRASKVNEEAWTHHGYYQYYYRVYLDPYNGKVMYVENSRDEFFQLVISLHMRLLLGPKIGHPLVAYSVLLFVLMLISGLVLWYPKKWTKATRKQRFRIKWDAKWKRLRYDLHNVLGFYVFIPALAIAFTGLVWTFDGLNTAVYSLLSGGQGPDMTKLRSDSSTRMPQPLDKALQLVFTRQPHADIYTVRFPAKPSATINMNVRLQDGKNYPFVRYDFDQYSGRLIRWQAGTELNAGEKMQAINYDVHIGSVLGLPGRILAFFVSLACATMPVTGFLMWRAKSRS